MDENNNTTKKKKRRKKYKLNSYDDIQVTLEALFNQVYNDEEQNYKKVATLKDLLALRLQCLKQHELQEEYEKMIKALDEYNNSLKGGGF